VIPGRMTLYKLLLQTATLAVTTMRAGLAARIMRLLKFSEGAISGLAYFEN
jgi:hypothetical protein